MIDRDTSGRKVRKGILHALVPMRAYRSLVDIKDSFVRIGRMIRGEPLAPRELSTPTAQAEDDLVSEGRNIVGELDPVARFNLFYTAMKWTEVDFRRQMTAIRRGHAIRLCAMGVALLLIPSLWVKYGWMSCIYDISVIAYLAARCIKSACLYTQMEERSLVEFKDLRARQGYWLLKRSFWFLD